MQVRALEVLGGDGEPGRRSDLRERIETGVRANGLEIAPERIVAPHHLEEEQGVLNGHARYPITSGSDLSPRTTNVSSHASASLSRASVGHRRRRVAMAIRASSFASAAPTQ